MDHSSKKQKSGTPLILGYWRIRGLAQPIRYLLECASASYTDELCVQGPAPDFDRTEGLKTKTINPHGLDFPNLPYLIDTDAGIKMTQSRAILRYVSRKYGFEPSNEKDLVAAEMTSEAFLDLKDAFVDICYNSKFHSLKEEYLNKTAPEHLNRLEKYFSSHVSNDGFLCGQKLVFADFIIFETLEGNIILESSILDKYPHLKSYHQRFSKIPQIAAYRNSNRFIKELNNVSASFR